MAKVLFRNAVLEFAGMLLFLQFLFRFFFAPKTLFISQIKKIVMVKYQNCTKEIESNMAFVRMVIVEIRGRQGSINEAAIPLKNKQWIAGE